MNRREVHTIVKSESLWDWHEVRVHWWVVTLNISKLDGHSIVIRITLKDVEKFDQCEHKSSDELWQSQIMRRLHNYEVFPPLFVATHYYKIKRKRYSRKLIYWRRRVSVAMYHPRAVNILISTRKIIIRKQIERKTCVEWLSELTVGDNLISESDIAFMFYDLNLFESGKTSASPYRMQEPGARALRKEVIRIDEVSSEIRALRGISCSVTRSSSLRPVCPR